MDANHSFAKEIFKHEYLHLLTAKYIEPYEIPAPVDQKILDTDRKIYNLENKIENLNEEMDYVEDCDAISIQLDISRIRNEIHKLKQEKRTMVAKSPSYFTESAYKLFKNVRDELSAYAVSGFFNTKEDNLVRQTETWQRRLSEVKDQTDRAKLVAQWKKLKLTINRIIQDGIQAEEVLPIFLTSQNFDQMTKRLLLFSKRRSEEQGLQQAE